jgi:hypothetical protein
MTLTECRWARALVLVAALSLPVSCTSGASSSAVGGGSSAPRFHSAGPTTSPVPTRLSRAEYLARANAICSQMNTQISFLIDPSDPVQTNPVAVDGVADLSAQALRELRSLPTPPSGQARLAAIFTSVDRLIALIRSEARALRGGQDALARRLDARVVSASREANALSNAYGLTACGK